MNNKLLKFILLLSLFFALLDQSLARTLIISDSHGTGAFGGQLARLIESKNEKVSFYAFGGTTPIHWVEGPNLIWGYWEHHTGRIDRRGENRHTPKLVELIASLRPTTVMISLGTNMIWREQLPQDSESIAFLINSIKNAGAKCIWIGPPDLNPETVDQKRRDMEVHQQLEQEIIAHGCSLISSWTFTHYPEGKGDGVHYDQIPKEGKQIAKDWANGVFARLNY